MNSAPGAAAGSAPTQSPVPGFQEKLWPSPWLFVILLLLIPAVMLTVTPVRASFALPSAIAVYVLIAGALALMSPSISVQGGELRAGQARIPVSLLGEMQLLDDVSLRRTVGPGADARAYLLLRGYIHRGVRIEVADPADPTPYWVLSTRRPQSLIAAIEAAKPRA